MCELPGHGALEQLNSPVSASAGPIPILQSKKCSPSLRGAIVLPTSEAATGTPPTMLPTEGARAPYRLDEVDPQQLQAQRQNTPQTFVLPESHDVPFTADFAQQDVYNPADRIAKPGGQLAGQLQSAMSLNPVQQHQSVSQTPVSAQAVYFRHHSASQGAQYHEQVSAGPHAPFVKQRMLHNAVVSQGQTSHHQQIQQQHQRHQQSQSRPHHDQRHSQQIQRQNVAPRDLLSSQNLFMRQPLQHTQHQQHPQLRTQQAVPEPERTQQPTIPSSPAAASWIQQWQQYRPSPIAIAQQYVDFWAVLRLSALAREWTFPALGSVATRPPQTQLSRGVVSMYICNKTHCASNERTVLHRSSGILVPVQIGDGVVVGHFFEKVWTPHSGTHKETYLQGKYIMCTRTREVVKFIRRPVDGFLAQSLCIDRSVMINEGVFLRDFVVVSVPHRHRAGTIPEQFAVTMRTTVVHTLEESDESDGNPCSAGNKAPFVSLDMNEQTAAQVTIDPSYGFHGFGIYSMTITPSCAGIDISSGHTPQRALGMSWVPPIHISHCAEPVWCMKQLNRGEAGELRRLFNASYSREQMAIQSQRNSGMNLPATNSGQALNVVGGGLPDIEQGRGSAISGDDSRAHSQLHSTITHQLFQMSMPLNFSPIHLNYSTAQASMPTGSSFVTSPAPQRSLAQSPPVQPASAQHPSTSPRLSSQPNLTQSLVGDARRTAGTEYMLGPSNFPVRSISSTQRATQTQTPTTSSRAGSAGGKPKTFRGTRRRNQALPAPTEKEVIMRNRISAQKSNEKRRKKLDSMKIEVAYLRDTLIPRLEMTKMLLQNENRRLMNWFSELYGPHPIVSFHSQLTPAAAV